LKHKYGFWFRRIDDEHRLMQVYRWWNQFLAGIIWLMVLALTVRDLLQCGNETMLNPPRQAGTITGELALSISFTREWQEVLGLEAFLLQIQFRAINILKQSL
jgi:hypothetical protein